MESIQKPFNSNRLYVLHQKEFFQFHYKLRFYYYFEFRIFDGHQIHSKHIILHIFLFRFIADILTKYINICIAFQMRKFKQWVLLLLPNCPLEESNKPTQHI